MLTTNDVPADRSTPTSAPPVQPSLRAVVRARRRRPTGEPPPLPYHPQPSVGWLLAAGVLIVLSIVVFRGGRGPRDRGHGPR